jgi:hypothetical protein
LVLEEETILRLKESEILCVTAIALCDLEEHKTFVPPQHFETNHFFVKLAHCVKVLDEDRYFAQSLDPAI